jgi:hypothetical protein
MRGSQLELNGITKNGYKKLVLERLNIGDSCNLWETVRSDEPSTRLEKVKIQNTYIVTGFYRNFITLKNKSGVTVTYAYDEVYKMMNGII